MAAKKHRRKSNKNYFFCCFRGCFGISTKVSAVRGDGKSVNKFSGKIPMSSEISREIHVVEDDKGSQINLADELTSNKTNDVVLVKGKNKDEQIPLIKQNSIAGKERSTELWASVSLPLPRQKKGKSGGGGGEKGKKGREKKVGGEIDPTVGAVVIMVALIVMLIWGKLCAVVCTAAWFYFIPRLRANLELKDGRDIIDFDSSEYKKKVVLQGLLQRDHHL